MPAYMDNIHLKQELQYMLYWGVYGATLAAGLVTGGFLTKYISYFWISTALSPLLNIFEFGVILTSTYKVLQWNDLIVYRHSEHNFWCTFFCIAQFELSLSKASLSPKRIQLIAVKSSDQISALSLSEVVARLDLMEVFMDFLLTEFAQENLLAIIELAQFKEYVYPQNMEKQGLIISLPPDIVQSEIVFSNTKSNIEKFQSLIQKYILNNAPYCVNIPYGQRMHLLHLYNNITTHPLDQLELALAFDTCIKEIWNLMRGAFNRFSSTPLYQKLCTTV